MLFDVQVDIREDFRVLDTDIVVSVEINDGSGSRDLPEFF
jgi:hypothetical protein